MQMTMMGYKPLAFVQTKARVTPTTFQNFANGSLPTSSNTPPTYNFSSFPYIQSLVKSDVHTNRHMSDERQTMNAKIQSLKDSYLHPTNTTVNYFDPRASSMLSFTPKRNTTYAWSKDYVPSVDLGPTWASSTNNKLQQNGYLHPSKESHG